MRLCADCTAFLFIVKINSLCPICSFSVIMMFTEVKLMRLDKYLKVSRIIKRRTVASEACDKKRVSVNGNQAKSGKDIKVGDEIEIRFGANTLKIAVSRIAETVRKEDSGDMYEILEETRNG